MKTKLKMKCKQCGNWNSIQAEKVLFNPESPQSKVQVYIPSYLPLKVECCSKCKSVIAQPDEIVRIVKS
jgi:hypothetical protein